MMRLAWFFILSVSLHATALVYPVSFGGNAPIEAIRVTILPVGKSAGGAGGQSGLGNPKRPGDQRSRRARTPSVEPRVRSKSLANREPDAQPINDVVIASDSNIERVAATADSLDTFAVAIFNSEDDNWIGSDPSVSRTGSGSGVHATGTGNGRGSGKGMGSSSSGMGTLLTQARYRDTPRPEYPDEARREGREGRVLLRVLIDDQGEAKAVEITDSSGSDALDQAATSAIKRWLFHPARAGDEPIESWVNIPVDFRLTETKH